MFQIDNTVRSAFASAIGNPCLLSRRISNPSDVVQAIMDVYRSRSIIARRMPKRASITASVTPLLTSLGTTISDYFNCPPNTPLNQTTYDEFFYGLCGTFLTAYNALASASTHGIPTIEFGIAQKLINMTFKYLSCYEDYSRYADLFRYCHVPIDSYILHYFNCRTIVPGIFSRFTTSMISPCADYSMPGTASRKTWSNLSMIEYQTLVSQYRISLSGLYPDHTYLHIEFYIWSHVKSRTPGAIHPFFPSPSLSGHRVSFHR